MEEGTLHIQKCIMILTGTWPITGQHTLTQKIYKIYSVFIQSYYNIFMVVLLINAIMKLPCMDLFIEMICYGAVHINAAILHLFALRDHMKKAQSCIVHYERVSYPKEDESSRKMYNYYSKLTNQVNKYSIITLSTSCCLSCYIVTIYMRLTQGTEECQVKQGLIYQIWYPFNSPYNYWLSVVFDLIMCCIGVLMCLQSRMYTLTLITFQLGQIKILANMLRNMDRDAEGLTQIYKITRERSIEITINKCIKRHQNVISLMDQIRRATKEMMLIGYFSNTFELAAFTIQILTATSTFLVVRALTILPGDAVQYMVFFWLANEVYVESMELSRIIYNELDWLSYNKETQKTLLIMMMRSQRALQFRATGVGVMNLEQYLKVLKGCYSIATFFQTMYGD